MKNYRALFERTVEELDSNPHLEVELAEIGAANTADDIEDIEASFGLRLPEALRSFYSQVGATKIAWRFSEPLNLGKYGEHVIEGRINLLSVHDVFWGYGERGWNNVLFFDHMEGDELNRMRSLRPVDLFDSEDNGCVSLSVDGSTISSRLTLFSTDGGYHPLALELGRYIELVTRAKGLIRWPFLMVKNNKFANNAIFKATMKELLPRLFDSNDQARQFLAALASIKRASNA